MKIEAGRLAWDADNPAGKAIRAALDAQAELSDLLRKTLNRLPESAPEDFESALTEALFQTDRRISEMQTLLWEFVALAGPDAQNPAPAAAARLDRTLESLVPGQALQMHGNDQVAQNFRDVLAPIAARIDALAANPEQALSDDEITGIRAQLDAAKIQFGQAEARDRTLLDAARAELYGLRQRLADIRKDVSEAALRNFVEKTFSPPDIPLFQEKFLPLMKGMAPELVKAIDLKNRLGEAAARYLADPTQDHSNQMCGTAFFLSQLVDSPSGDIKRLRGDVFQYKSGWFRQKSVPMRDLLDAGNDAMDKFVASLPRQVRKACTPEFVAEFRAALQSFLANRDRDAAKLDSAYGCLWGIGTQTAHLAAMRDTANRLAGNGFTTNKTLQAAFEGRIAVTTLVETRLNGLPDEDADPALDDANAVSESPLGQGGVNTVFEVGYRDGSAFVFKPEAPGRTAMEVLTLANGAYHSTTLLAQLNMAAQRTADVLGLDDVMTKTAVGSHGGQFGLFMEKAPGKEAHVYRRENQPAEPGRLNADQIKALPPARYAQVIGDIMRKANRLEWFDIVTGQNDRHDSNYLLDIAEDGTVSLKGIDNDMCFPVYAVGARKYLLTGSHEEKFFDEVDNVSWNLYPFGTERDVRARHREGIHERPDGMFEVDAAKFEAPELHYCLHRAFAAHSTHIPEFMDEDLYNRLMALRDDAAQKAYLDGLAARLPSEAVDAARRRLKDVIDIAEKLHAAGKIVPAADWHDPARQKTLAGPLPQIDPADRTQVLAPPLPPVNGRSPCRHDIAKFITDRTFYATSGYFRRDLMAHLAKPGWFEA